MEVTKEKDFLTTRIIESVFVRGDDDTTIRSLDGSAVPWIFDFKKVLLDPKVLSACTALFFERYKDVTTFCVGGVETTALPLVTAIVLEGEKRGHKVTGFFIRKGRKKHGLFNHIEGDIPDHVPIILVDDILNSGASFAYMESVLNEYAGMHKKDISIYSFFSLLQYRDKEAYTYFVEKGIRVETIFTLNDFTQLLTEKDQLSYRKDKVTPSINAHKVLWSLRGKNPNYSYTGTKATPLAYDDKVVFLTDQGYVMCVLLSSGKEVWKYFISHVHELLGRAFYDPLFTGESVIIATADGVVYSFAKDTGELLWNFRDAEYINASPCYVASKNCVLVPCTYVSATSRSELVALDVATREVLYTIPSKAPITGTPLFLEKSTTLLFGAGNTLYVYDGDTKVMRWSKDVTGVIVEKPSISPDGTTVVIGTVAEMNKEEKSGVYVISLHDGEEKASVPLSFGTYSSPLIYNDLIIFSSLNKKVYAYDYIKKEMVWTTKLRARSFTSPVLVGNNEQKFVYVGANDGGLYTINLSDGNITNVTFLADRIVDTCVVVGRSVIVATQANTVTCLEDSVLSTQ